MAKNKWDKNLIYETIEFAERAHAGQTLQRQTDVPYSCHFVNVMLNALNFLTEDVNYTYLIQLAVLHDIIEDTSISYEDLKNRFGKCVADGVLALTRDINIPKDKQIRDCIQRIKQQPKEVSIVKLADRLYNMRSRVPEPIWSIDQQEKYKIDGQLICDELSYACPNLANELQSVIDSY